MVTTVRPTVETLPVGEPLVFDGLYRDCAQPIFNFVLRSVRDPQRAEDICQEVWTKAYRSLDSLRKNTSARAWLYRIAKHATIDDVRRRSTQPLTSELAVEPPSRPGDDPLETVMRSEQAALAWQTLGALPERQQMALYLKEVDERSYREIAEILECSESAVETLLVRARRSFAEHYEGLSEHWSERCAQARRVMSTWVDGEGSPVLRQSLRAHLDECAECRELASASERQVAARAAIPLLPLPIGGIGIAGSAGAAGHAGLRALLARILELFAAKAATVAVTAAATGVIAVSAVAGSYDTPMNEAQATTGGAIQEASLGAPAPGSASIMVTGETRSSGAVVTPGIPAAGAAGGSLLGGSVGVGGDVRIGTAGAVASAEAAVGVDVDGSTVALPSPLAATTAAPSAVGTDVSGDIPTVTVPRVPNAADVTDVSTTSVSSLPVTNAGAAQQDVAAPASPPSNVGTIQPMATVTPVAVPTLAPRPAVSSQLPTDAMPVPATP